MPWPLRSRLAMAARWASVTLAQGTSRPIAAARVSRTASVRPQMPSLPICAWAGSGASVASSSSPATAGQAQPARARTGLPSTAEVMGRPVRVGRERRGPHGGEEHACRTTEVAAGRRRVVGSTRGGFAPLADIVHVYVGNPCPCPSGCRSACRRCRRPWPSPPRRRSCPRRCSPAPCASGWSRRRPGRCWSRSAPRCRRRGEIRRSSGYSSSCPYVDATGSYRRWSNRSWRSRLRHPNPCRPKKSPSR